MSEKEKLADMMAWAMREGSEFTHAICLPLAYIALSAIEAAGYELKKTDFTRDLNENY